MITLSHPQRDHNTLYDLAPDLTPMLDILFILLVFFMLTAGAVFQTLELELPSGVSSPLPDAGEKNRLVVEIRPGGYGLNQQTFPDFEELKNSLSEQLDKNPQSDVIVAGDRLASIEKLLRVLTYLESRGIKTANILMQDERATGQRP